MNLSVSAQLAALRSSGPGTDVVRARLAHAPEPSQRASHARERAAVVHVLARSLASSDYALVRWLLEQEIADHEANGAGATETLYTLVAALARFGRARDVLLLWRAREATAETRAGMDVEQVARAGLERVRAYLHRAREATGSRRDAAVAALAWIEASAAEGAFADLPAYFAWADERYGLEVSGPT